MDKEGLISEINTHITQLGELKDWLEKLGGEEALSIWMRQPIAGLLVTAIDYVEVNLGQIRDRYELSVPPPGE